MATGKRETLEIVLKVGGLPGTAHYGGNIADIIIPNAGAPEDAGAPDFFIIDRMFRCIVPTNHTA